MTAAEEYWLLNRRALPQWLCRHYRPCSWRQEISPVSGKLQFVHFAPLRGFDYSFGKNLSHCTRVSRPSKSATGFFNPLPCVIQSRDERDR
jgi:hypothetical protein